MVMPDGARALLVLHDRLPDIAKETVEAALSQDGEGWYFHTIGGSIGAEPTHPSPLSSHFCVKVELSPAIYSLFV
jgi:hypothetical protein